MVIELSGVQSTVQVTTVQVRRKRKAIASTKLGNTTNASY